MMTFTNHSCGVLHNYTSLLLIGTMIFDMTKILPSTKLFSKSATNDSKKGSKAFGLLSGNK